MEPSALAVMEESLLAPESESTPELLEGSWTKAVPLKPGSPQNPLLSLLQSGSPPSKLQSLLKSRKLQSNLGAFRFHFLAAELSACPVTIIKADTNLSVLFIAVLPGRPVESSAMQWPVLAYLLVFSALGNFSLVLNIFTINKDARNWLFESLPLIFPPRP